MNPSSLKTKSPLTELKDNNPKNLTTTKEDITTNNKTDPVSPEEPKNNPSNPSFPNKPTSPEKT